MTQAGEASNDSRARRLYGAEYENSGRTYFYGPSDYGPIIQSLGEVLVEVSDRDYQGDTRVLFRKDGRYGFLNFGWGSCSGCDALQACESFQEIDDLIQGLEQGIKWFDTLAEAQAYIGNDADRSVSYYYHEDEWLKFKAAVLAYTEAG